MVIKFSHVTNTDKHPRGLRRRLSPRRALVPMNELLASHGKFRVAWKEFPRG